MVTALPVFGSPAKCNFWWVEWIPLNPSPKKTKTKLRGWLEATKLNDLQLACPSPSRQHAHTSCLVQLRMLMRDLRMPSAPMARIEYVLRTGCVRRAQLSFKQPLVATALPKFRICLQAIHQLDASDSPPLPPQKVKPQTKRVLGKEKVVVGGRSAGLRTHPKMRKMYSIGLELNSSGAFLRGIIDGSAEHAVLITGCPRDPHRRLELSGFGSYEPTSVIGGML